MEVGVGVGVGVGGGVFRLQRMRHGFSCLKYQEALFVNWFIIRWNIKNNEEEKNKYYLLYLKILKLYFFI